MTAVARTLVMWLSAQRPVGWGLLTGTRCWPLWGSPCPCGTPCAGSSPYFSQSSKWNTVLFIFLSPLPLRCSCFIQRYVLAHIISSYEGGWGVGGRNLKSQCQTGAGSDWIAPQLSFLCLLQVTDCECGSYIGNKSKTDGIIIPLLLLSNFL